MDIFGIGLPEVLMIGVVAIIVLGPDRLPEAARTLGKAVADFRRAIEPAKNAWADVSREITAATQVSIEGPGSGNPWTVHPVADRLSDEERRQFFATGELPEWKIQEMAQMESTHKNGASEAQPHEVQDLDYPMPHAKLSYYPAPPFSELHEELDYPEPGKN